MLCIETNHWMLNLLMGFLSPQIDPEYSDGPTLLTRGSDEFRPFVRHLPEFKFWPIRLSQGPSALVLWWHSSVRLMSFGQYFFSTGWRYSLSLWRDRLCTWSSTDMFHSLLGNSDMMEKAIFIWRHEHWGLRRGMLHSCCSEVDAVTLCLLRKMVVKKSNWIPLKFGFELYFLFSSATNDILSL